MTKAELEGYRRRLLSLRERLTGNMSNLANEALNPAGDNEGNLSHVPIHMADLGSDAFERDNTLNLLANEREILGEIDVALRRIDQGTYGRCDECQGPILPKDRLKELPYTRHCVGCARKREQEGS